MSEVVSSGPSSTPSAATPSPSGGGASSNSSPAKPAVAKTPTTPAASAPSTPAPQSNTRPSIGDQVKQKEPAAQVAPETPAEKRARKAKVKIDGKESEVDFDSLPVDELAYRYQMSEAAQRRMQEAAELKKKFGDIVSYGKENLVDAVKQLWGVDLNEWSESNIVSRFEEAQLPEHEKRARELEARLAKYEKAEQERQALLEQEHQTQYERQVYQETEAKFINALNKLDYPKEVASSILPVMTELASAALDKGFDMDEHALAYETEKRLRTMGAHQIKGLKGDKLLEHLGPAVVDEVIRARLAKAQKLPPVAPIPSPKPKEEVKDDGRPLSFRKRLLGARKF